MAIKTMDMEIKPHEIRLPVTFISLTATIEVTNCAKTETIRIKPIIILLSISFALICSSQEGVNGP